MSEFHLSPLVSQHFYIIEPTQYWSDFTIHKVFQIFSKFIRYSFSLTTF